MHQGLTAVQTAQVVGELHWIVSRLFEVIGGWAGEADRPDIAVSMATSSRHLGWHAGDLEELLPDSTLLQDDIVRGPHAPEVAAALDAIRVIPGSIEQLAVTHRVLLPRVAARCVSVERASGNHSDAALARALSFLLADLRRDRDDGEALLGRLLTDVETVEQANARVLEAESRLVEAGGLLPIGITD